MSYSKIKCKHFTLIEVIVAMGIFLTAIAPMMGLLMATTKMHTDNMKKVKAQMLAKEELSNLLLYKNNTRFNNDTHPLGLQSKNQDWGRHPHYNNLYYSISGSIEEYNLVKFRLGVCYTSKYKDKVALPIGVSAITEADKDNVDEYYELYVNAQE